MSECLSQSACKFEPLDWDSKHYEMSVGRITGAVGRLTQLEDLLDLASRSGATLVYYCHSAPFVVTETILRRFGGRRVGGHVRYARSLDTLSPSGSLRSDLHVEAYEGPDDDSTMKSMAISAGALSRFRTDDRLPASKCDELYSV
jgi:hypothetical protein